MKMIKKGTKIKHKTIRFECPICGSVYEALDNDRDITWENSFSDVDGPLKIVSNELFSYYCLICNSRSYSSTRDDTTEVFYAEEEEET